MHFCAVPERGKEQQRWHCEHCGQNWWFYDGVWRMCAAS